MAPQIQQKYITTSGKGEKVLYTWVQNKLYGMSKSKLLFYLKLKKNRQEYDFVVNPYVKCATNKIVGGHQMTVEWHVDDRKVSHKDLWEVTKLSQ